MFYRAALLACILLATSVLVSAEVLFTRSSPPAGWTQKHRADASAPVTFLLALKQRNLAALEAKFWSVSDPQSAEYRHFLSSAQINELIAPKAADVEVVRTWLLLHGVPATQFELLGDAIEVSTQVSVAERLFQTEFYQFTHEVWGKTVVRQYGSLSVPHEVVKRLDLITGITDFPFPPRRTRYSRLRESTTEMGVIPQTVYSLYNIPAQTFGNASSITSQGVIEFDQQYFSPEDVQQFAELTGIQITPISADHIFGNNYDYNTGAESTLDLEFIAGVNTEATNWFWIENLSDSAWMYEFAVHFANATNVPQVISISYGWYEGAQCYADPNGCNELGVDDDGYVARMNVEWQKMGLRGVSVLVSSGDSGAHTRTDEDCTAPTLRVEYPAASPYVTSVGGTQLENTVALATQPKICSTYGVKCAGSGTEVAVSFAIAGFTSGGGFSEVADQPAYQAEAVKAYVNSGVKLPDAIMYNASRRAHPDVSAVGHMNMIVLHNYIELIGGTSASAPIFAAIASMLNQASIAKSGQPLGFLNPLLYQIASQVPTAFNDITSGDNVCTEDGCAASCQGWIATKGWDPVTGLGTPNYEALLAYISTH